MATTYIYTLDSGLGDGVTYIGKTNKKPSYRLSNHIYESKNGCETKKCLWVKENNYNINIKIVDEVPLDEWEFWEIYWIEQFTVWGFTLLNSNNGGGGVTKHSKEFSTWLSNRNLNNKNMLGKKHTKETKERLSIVNMGKVGPNKGVKFSQEWKDKLSKSKKGKTSPKKGTKWSKRTRSKMEKPIQQLNKSGDLIKEWCSIRKASTELSISEGNIVTVCKGNRKSAGGYKWIYKNG